MFAAELNGLVDLSKAAIYEDNEACIKIASNEVGSSRTKHIDIKYHYCRDIIKQGHATVVHVPTQLQLADTLTKNANPDIRKRHTWAWGLRASMGSHWTNT